jgi:hypothetical protein
MGYMRGAGRHQTDLLPEPVAEDIGAENPLRFLDALVEPLDLESCGGGWAPAADPGRPGDEPGDLWRL